MSISNLVTTTTTADIAAWELIKVILEQPGSIFTTGGLKMEARK